MISTWAQDFIEVVGSRPSLENRGREMTFTCLYFVSDQILYEKGSPTPIHRAPLPNHLLYSDSAADGGEEGIAEIAGDGNLMAKTAMDRSSYFSLIQVLMNTIIEARNSAIDGGEEAVIAGVRSTTGQRKWRTTESDGAC
nr:hypothetical protein Iba_chr14aCG3900 [Ipomoea batatas]